MSMEDTRAKSTYRQFSGDDLNIAELIQQRRLQLLVHSRIYYTLNHNVVSDKKWDQWAKELVRLQNDYPGVAEKIVWHEAFADWDGCSGAFLTLNDPWVVRKGLQCRHGWKV